MELGGWNWVCGRSSSVEMGGWEWVVDLAGMEFTLSGIEFYPDESYCNIVSQCKKYSDKYIRYEIVKQLI